MVGITSGVRFYRGKDVVRLAGVADNSYLAYHRGFLHGRACGSEGAKTDGADATSSRARSAVGACESSVERSGTLFGTTPPARRAHPRRSVAVRGGALAARAGSDLQLGHLRAEGSADLTAPAGVQFVRDLHAAFARHDLRNDRGRVPLWVCGSQKPVGKELSDLNPRSF